jgi:recombination protein U
MTTNSLSERRTSPMKMTADNYKKHIQGAEAKSAGDAFERLIADACDYYRRRKIAEIDKNSEPIKVTKPLGNGKFECFFLKRAQPDFKGTLQGGRSIVMEAKSVNDKRIAIDAVREHQADALDSHAELGAECYVLASLPDNLGKRRYAKVPWEHWKEPATHVLKSGAEKELRSHSWVDLAPWEVPLSGGILRFLEPANEFRR